MNYIICWIISTANTNYTFIIFPQSNNVTNGDYSLTSLSDQYYGFNSGFLSDLSITITLLTENKHVVINF